MIRRFGDVGEIVPRNEDAKDGELTFYKDPRNTIGQSSNGETMRSCSEWQETNEARRRGEKKQRKFRSRRLAARITRGSGRFIRAARMEHDAR